MKGNCSTNQLRPSKELLRYDPCRRSHRPGVGGESRRCDGY